MIGYGKTPISPAGEKVRALDRDQAADSIRLALPLGFKDLAQLDANPDIAPLLEREDRQATARRAESPSLTDPPG